MPAKTIYPHIPKFQKTIKEDFDNVVNTTTELDSMIFRASRSQSPMADVIRTVLGIGR
jgi:hypothetical protein